MKEYMEERVRAVAAYILETGCTVRACAERFKVSKTTVHKDMRTRLPKINPALARDVSRVLDKNREDRHLRGGDAKRRKFERARGT